MCGSVGASARQPAVEAELGAHVAGMLGFTIERGPTGKQ
jgi:hypothetical protein